MEPDEVIKAYRLARADYAYDGDPFNEDPDRVRLVKQIISEKLPQVDRTLIVLYADCQSYRKLGKALGLSHMTVRKEILRIRAEILAEYEKIKDKDK
jgi:DNA-directed RNA polymerase specialized sigma24 family protein